MSKKSFQDSFTSTATNNSHAGIEPKTVYLLFVISLLYISIPSVIFFVGWFNNHFGTIALLLVIIPLISTLRRTYRTIRADKPSMDEPVLAGPVFFTILISSFCVMLISGVGGIGPQDSDWLKHNAIFNDLIQHPWPVVYTWQGVSLPMVYYIAYYLPAAAVGKLADYQVAAFALYLWTYIGLVLSISWFVVLVRRRAYVSIILFFIFSGLDAVGIVARILIIGPPDKWDHLEWWADNWQYSSNITQLFFVPHQALVGWIVGGVLLYAIFYLPKQKEYLFYLSLTPLWSPLVTVGFAPFLLVDFFDKKNSLKNHIKRYTSIANICGVLLFLVWGVFYISKFFHIPIPLERSIYGFIFSIPETENVGWPVILHLGIWFLVFEFGLYGLLIAGGDGLKDRKFAALFAITIVILTTLPLFKYGRNNDLVMRASIPALFVLAVLLAKTITAPNRFNPKRLVLIVMAGLGAVTPAVEIGRHIAEIRQTGQLINIPVPGEHDDLFDLQAGRYDNKSFLMQYVGSMSSPFFEVLAESTNCQLPIGEQLQFNRPEPLSVELTDRFTLLCLNKELEDDQLKVDILLKTKPRPEGLAETHDTIYAHLIDQQHSRVTGDDVLLYKNYEDKSIVQHTIPLPADLKPGTYFLVIGTYFFEDDTLVNVGSITLDNPIFVN